ncbi:hypothetical protein [Herbiconiux sp.]|uniref:hypothetical protein n=1 Tax=Herbiconiux sp. TaxID=1871186 RepID=UPI0025BFB8C0|nr:hypothetical protein [Herbiconiux sp.]
MVADFSTMPGWLRRMADALGTLEWTGSESPRRPAASALAPAFGKQHREHELSIITGYDMTTLREKVDVRAASERLDELGQLRSLSALNEKVVLLRLLGRLDEAFTIANEAVRQARFSGDREQALGARIRRAQVQQFQGKYPSALQELGLCVEEAQTHEWGTLEATATLSRGKVHFETGDFDAALVDFKAAVFLMERLGASIDQLESSLVAVAVTESFLGTGLASPASSASASGSGSAASSASASTLPVIPTSSSSAAPSTSGA